MDHIKTTALILISILTVSANAEKEFSVNLDIVSLFQNFDRLNDNFSEYGFDSLSNSASALGLSASWKYNDNIIIELSADMYNDWVSRNSYDMDIFERFTFVGFVYRGNSFPLNICKPGLAVGFGSLQLRSPVESYLSPHPPFHIELPAIDPFLEHPTVESKLSKRFGLLDVSMGLTLDILLKRGAKIYSHLLVLQLKAGYIFTFAESEWSMGPVKVSDGPEVNMNSFYIRYQVGYGGSW